MNEIISDSKPHCQAETKEADAETLEPIGQYPSKGSVERPCFL